MEDYNTATMPHRKYYEYEKWEVEDYEKRQRRDAKRKGRVQTEFNDEVSPPARSAAGADTSRAASNVVCCAAARPAG